MNALCFLLSLPFRLVMLVSGALSVFAGTVSVVFLIIGTGAALFADAFGGDRS